jgi:hypothetical protein
MRRFSLGSERSEKPDNLRYDKLAALACPRRIRQLLCILHDGLAGPQGILHDAWEGDYELTL